MNNEDIGWLKANVEQILQNQQNFDKRLDVMEEQISIYRNAIKFVKFSGGAILLVLTLKFGDVSSLWTRIFNG